jgi:nicotinamide-nucleotide amidase
VKRAVILSVGDELVLGQTVDTNSAWLSQQLAALGLDIAGHMTVGDDQNAIAGAITQVAQEVDLLLISGGIGPTEDDLTRQALAQAMGVELRPDEACLSEIRAYFSRINRPMPVRNEVQALVPAGATHIPNSCGTAPGLAGQIGGCRIFVMPGVPKEMFAMWRLSVAAQVEDMGGGSVILSRTLHTFGMGESAVAERLGTLMDRSRNPSVGTTVAAGVVSLRLNARAGARSLAEIELQATDNACRAALGDLIYGSDAETLPKVVHRQLLTSGLTVATAESCTAGLLGAALTDQPGASAYFQQGYTTYSNAAKVKVLGVPESMIAALGAVSEPVAVAMAEGAAQASGASMALSITGIAGPDGGSAQKPVGTVCMALAAGRSKTFSRTFHFPGDRDMVRDRSVKMALTLIRFQLLGRPLPF